MKKLIAIAGFCLVVALLIAQQTVAPTSTPYVNFTTGIKFGGSYGTAGSVPISTGSGTNWGTVSPSTIAGLTSDGLAPGGIIVAGNVAAATGSLGADPPAGSPLRIPTEHYVDTSQMVNVMSLGCKVDGTTDDTTCWQNVAANLNGKTYYLPAGTGCSIINGWINIGSVSYLPGSFRIIGAANGGLGSCIQQNTDNVGIFQFTRELTNTFDIEWINFTALHQQTAATSETADTNATAILFNPTTHNLGGEFNFTIAHNNFANFARGIGVQKQVSSVGVVNPVWGFNIDNNICNGTLTGACFNLLEGSPTGNPRCSFHGNYATNVNTTEPQFVEYYCNALQFTDNESNNAHDVVADLTSNDGVIAGFHIESHTLTTSGEPIIAMENSNIVTIDVDLGSHVCPGSSCGASPVLNLLSNVSGGGSVTGSGLIFTAYSDSTSGWIANAARVGSNTISTGSKIGVAQGFTNCLRPGDASNSLFAEACGVFNIASQISGFLNKSQTTPQQILVTTSGSPQAQMQFGSGAVGPGLVWYSSLGDAVHWKPGTAELANDGTFHFTACPQITAIPTGAAAYPSGCTDSGTISPAGFKSTAASCTSGALLKGDNTGCTATTGTGNVVQATSATLTSPTLNSPTLVTPALGAATGTSLTLGGGSNVVYRCTTAGTLPVGALTTNTANCGASAATVLTVN